MKWNATQYDLDPKWRQFLLKTTNPMGHISRATFYGVNEPLSPSSYASFGKLARSYAPSLPGQTPPRFTFTMYDSLGRLSLRQLFYESSKLSHQETWSYPLENPTGSYAIFHSTTLSISPWTTISSIKSFDSLGRLVLKKTQGDFNSWICAETLYGPFGGVYKSTAPFRSQDTALSAPLLVYPGESKRWSILHQVDPFGQSLRAEPIQGAITSYTHEPFVKRVTDPSGLSSEVEKDGLDRIIRSSQFPKNHPPIHVKVSHSHWLSMPAETTADPQGHTTLVYRDQVGRVTQRVDADRGTNSFQYDAHGNTVLKTSPKGIHTRYKYDVLDRLVQEDVADDGSPEVIYYYDGTSPTQSLSSPKALGQRSAMSDPSGYTQWGYDALGRTQFVLKRVDKDAFFTTYAYDAAGRLTQYTQGPLLKAPILTVHLSHLLEGLAHVSLSYSTTKIPCVQSIEYNAQGGLQNLHLANQTSLQNSYDPLTGRLKTRKAWSAKESWMMNLAYAYDSVGIPTSIKDVKDPSASQFLSYDSLHRLSKATGVYGSIGYSYDLCGNLWNHGPLTLWYDNAAHPHAVASVQEKSGVPALPYAYSPEGALLSRPGQALTYNGWGHLSSISTPNAQLALLSDATGRRVRRATGSKSWIQLKPGSKSFPSISTSSQLLTPFDSMEVEVDGKGDRSYRFHIQVGGQRIATLEFPCGKSPSLRYLFSDHLGSGSMVTDEQGKIVQQTRYAPYGVPLDPSGNPQWSWSLNNTAMYGGAELDPTTHLYLTGPRTYDPILGRFLQPDPIFGETTLPESLNPYTYALNSPFAFKDPSGRSPQGAFWGSLIGAFVGGLVGNPLGGAMVGGFVGTLVSGAIEGIRTGDLGSALQGAVASAITTGVQFLFPPWLSSALNVASMIYATATGKGLDIVAGFAGGLLGNQFSTALSSVVRDSSAPHGAALHFARVKDMKPYGVIRGFDNRGLPIIEHPSWLTREIEMGRYYSMLETASGGKLTSSNTTILWDGIEQGWLGGANKLGLYRFDLASHKHIIVMRYLNDYPTLFHEMGHALQVPTLRWWAAEAGAQATMFNLTLKYATDQSRWATLIDFYFRDELRRTNGISLPPLEAQ
jgi:RHS repeat-associated protein